LLSEAGTNAGFVYKIPGYTGTVQPSLCLLVLFSTLVMVAAVSEDLEDLCLVLSPTFEGYDEEGTGMGKLQKTPKKPVIHAPDMCSATPCIEVESNTQGALVSRYEQRLILI
jgi:hypothetical protein